MTVPTHERKTVPSDLTGGPAPARPPQRLTWLLPRTRTPLFGTPHLRYILTNGSAPPPSPPAPPGCFSVTNRRPILGNYQSARHFLPSAHLSLTRISAFECVPLMLSSVPTTSPRLFSEGSGALTGWGRRFARGYKLTFLRPFYTSFDEKNWEDRE